MKLWLTFKTHKHHTHTYKTTKRRYSSLYIGVKQKERKVEENEVYEFYTT